MEFLDRIHSERQPDGQVFLTMEGTVGYLREGDLEDIKELLLTQMRLTLYSGEDSDSDQEEYPSE